LIQPIGLCRLLIVDPSEVSCRIGKGAGDDPRDERLGVVTRVACQLGIGTESLRCWAVKAEIDAGR
jgi:hypothetical protein